MRTLWILGGALVGRKAFGPAGAVLGGGLAYGLSILSDILRRVERLERLERTTQRAPSPGPAAERYPEEAIIDAMQLAEEDEAARGEEVDDLFNEVSGRKKRLH